MLGWIRQADADARVAAVEEEHRNYTDIVTNALVEAATDELASTYVSALETAAGQLSRAFTSATVTGPGAMAFGPWELAQIGRQLIESGEAVWFRVGQMLFRAETYSILPNGTYTLARNAALRTEPASRVFHVRFNMDVASGRGMAPLATARTIRTLMSKMEGKFSSEWNAAVGYLLPVPADGNAANIEQLKEDLGTLNGRIAVAETTQGGYDQGRSAAPRRDFELSRLGPNVPDGNVTLYAAIRDSILSACGYPPQLEGKAEGTAQREAWRRYLHGTVAPLGRLVQTEAARVGLPVVLDWDQLFASDISGRARAFQSLVNGGMSIEQAAAASGLLSPED